MPSTLAAALDSIVSADSELDRRIVNTDELCLNGVDQLELANQHYTLERAASESLRQLIGLPVGLIDRLQSSTLERVTQDLWNHGLTKEQPTIPEQLTLSAKDNRVAGISRADLVSVENARIVDEVANQLSIEQRDSASVDELNIGASGAFFLGVTFPTIATEPRKGDIVQAGLHISHSPVGDVPTRVLVRMKRLACENGMLTPICLEDRSLRVRRTASTDELLARFRFVLNTGLSQLQEKLGELKELVDSEVDPEEEIRLLAGRRRFNRRLRDAVLVALDEDEAGPGDRTRYDVLLALSRVATHGDLDPRRRNELLRFSGVYSQGNHVRRCPHCQSILIGNAPASSLN